MTATVHTSAAPAGWRIAVIGLVGLLAAGIGLAVGGFLLTRGGVPTGAGAAYVPSDAPFYLEWRLDPSEAQDTALRELLGRFPAIEGVDLDRPLYDQLGEAIDDALGMQDELELSWEDDIASWFDGTVAVAVTDVDWAAMTVPTDPMAPMPEPEMPGFVLVAGVTDRAAAESLVDRLRDAAEADGTAVSTTEHRGITIASVGETDGAYAVTDDALLVGPSLDDIVAALDTEAAGDGGSALASSDELRGLVDRLPADWIGFAVYDLTDLVTASFEQAELASPGIADAMRELIAHQPMRGAMAITAGGDRVAIDGVTAPPTGPFAVENADRGLAAEVPADALYFADGGNLGEALSAMITAFKQTAASDPAMEEQLGLAEAGLGAELEELVSWVDAGAVVAGWDGSEPYAGVLLVPNDVAAAERRLDQLVAFAGLAASDPASGLSVEERELAGTTVTTIRWEDPSAAPAEFLAEPIAFVLEVAMTEDRAIIGVGDRFVARVLELDEADSLARVPRYADAVAELGGASNAGVAYLDLAGTREAIETALAPMMAFMDPDGAYETVIRPWLEPLDRIVGVTRLEGDALVARTVLLVE